MKKYILSLYASLLVFASCDTFSDIKGGSEVTPIEVSVNLTLAIENIATIQDLTVNFDNYDEDLHISQECTGESVTVGGIIPGIWTITASGTVFDTDDTEYYVNGSIANRAIYNNGTTLDITIQGLEVSPLVFKELYYAGCTNVAGSNYFRDNFYELYNNSSEVQYLDGVHIANLYPTASTSSLPVWPEEDGDNYAYAARVWKFPGSGTDYPLEPGESCVLAQLAVNHQLEIYNPNSPVDCSSAEFEFYMNSTTYPDQPAYNMEHVFYNGSASIGTVQQYLTTVFGPAMVIFRVPEDETWDPVNDANMHTTNLGSSSSTLYAKIPVRYVLDGVECVDDETAVTEKRMPTVIDAGVTYVGSTYCGLSVARKPMYDDDGEMIRREDGSLIFQDTNNSTNDFDRELIPMLRRYDTGMPAWNHTLQ